jgi:MFS family permease
MLGATFDEHERSHAIGIWAGAGALTSAAGPLLGGYLVDRLSWPPIFLINVPIGVAAAGLAIFFACESRDDETKGIDWSGALTVASGLAAITWGLSAIPASGFRDQTVLVALGAGTALLAVFVAIEARSRDRAMMPLSLYDSRDFSATNALTLLLYFALGGALYYLPFGLIRIGGYSATQAGAALLPFALIMGSGASFAGTLADRFGPRLPLTAGPIIAACGLLLLALADLAGSYWTGVFPAICVLAAGMTIAVPPLTSTVMASAGKVHAGIASGVNNAVARVAGLLAVASLGAVLFASFSYYFAETMPANEALNAVLAGQADAAKDAIAAFDRALQIVMLVAAFSAALGGVIGWLGITQDHPASDILKQGRRAQSSAAASNLSQGLRVSHSFIPRGRRNMNIASGIKEHMDVISSDRKTVGKVDHLEGPDKIKLTRQSSPDGAHHHFIPVSWVDHVDQHVHLSKTGAEVTSHWQHGRQ